MERTYFEVDLSGVDTYGEFHTRVKNALELPEYYGENLDALYDMLTELGGKWSITFHHTRELEEALPQYVAKLQRLFADACRQQPGLEIQGLKRP